MPALWAKGVEDDLITGFAAGVKRPAGFLEIERALLVRFERADLLRNHRFPVSVDNKVSDNWS